ncbi:PVC-type heme-binding CxxCH protein [Tautonia marina]|uniref:PVC-type heme-binding CxxCH protein n=1 Tax=Tautonia marina TaxID=2653855 RepID=UPI0012605DEC|nr:PVC-type heme-binding CxxCH protein [Tautonia marina]
MMQLAWRTAVPLVSMLVLVLPESARSQGHPPDEAVARMTVAEGLTPRLVAAEPFVRQPVALDFDDRGRLWVLQYLQYPNPASLDRVAVDRYSRTVYDRIPEPPPHGPRGSDRLSILEDTDGDGRIDASRDFVSGLNLASGFAFGDGGVYVLNAPYLLFYPDRNRDDQPDADPEVLLTGFGMEDAHSVANSLTWGPDGWLYGLQGSTVTARIRGIEFQQGVWRYHRPTNRFELFAEGGGNMWGLDFDARGELIASTNVGGNVMLHMVPGGYYWKSFGKHGPLHNPYTFGYFDHVPHEGITGGHVAVGGLFAMTDALPDSLLGQYLAADLLDHSAHRHQLSRLGSTYQARQVGDLMRANDTWFAPSDMTLGPDGSLYLADWHDRRTAHPDPDADWDRSNGRIIALDGPGRRSIDVSFDLQSLNSSQWVALLDHPDAWSVRRALRLLREHPDESLLPDLRSRALDGRGSAALIGLWALHGVGGLDEQTALLLLDHPEPDVRSWVARLLGDRDTISPALADRLVTLAESDSSVDVRSCLLGVAACHPTTLGLPITSALLQRDEDEADPFIPLRLWWAIERCATEAPAETLDEFATATSWKSSLFRSVIADRLLRRFAGEGTLEGDLACLRLIDSSPTDALRVPLIDALDTATTSRPAPIASPLADRLTNLAAAHPDRVSLIRLAARAGQRDALDRALKCAGDPSQPFADRLAFLALIAERHDPSHVQPLLLLATGDPSLSLRLAALGALGRFDDETIPPALLASSSDQSSDWQRRALDLLLSWKSGTIALLNAVDQGQIAAEDLSTDQVARVAALGDPALDARVRKHWGAIASATPEERLAEVRRLNNDLRAGPGDPNRGRLLFREHCASCHLLFGEGQAIGPDLTHANRSDRDFLLLSLVDPSRVIRKEYLPSVVATQDGRILTGLLAEQSPTNLTLITSDGTRTVLPLAEVEEIADATASLMPDDLYRSLAPQELRDLFSYLQGTAPAAD